MVAIFPGSTLNSPLPIMCPIYIKDIILDSHFYKLVISQFFLKVTSKCATREKCSCHVLMNISMSCIFTITKVSMKGHITSFISLIKFAGALHKPKGIPNHSYKPCLILNVVFHISSALILTLWC